MIEPEVHKVGSGCVRTWIYPYCLVRRVAREAGTVGQGQMLKGPVVSGV